MLADLVGGSTETSDASLLGLMNEAVDQQPGTRGEDHAPRGERAEDRLAQVTKLLAERLLSPSQALSLNTVPARDLPSDLRFRLAAEADVTGTVGDPRAVVRLQ